MLADVVLASILLAVLGAGCYVAWRADKPRDAGDTRPE